MINDFIFLNRSLLDSRVFGDESLLRLWIWCILKANWKRGWFNDCEIKPGQFVTGRSSAAGELNVSGSKWYRGMNRLAEYGMVKMEVVNKQFTVVSVVNWHKYQTQRTAGEQPVNNQRTAGEQPVNTIEEGHKDIRKESQNKKENDSPGQFLSPSAEEVQTYIDQRCALNPNWLRAADLTGESFVNHYDAQGWVTGSGIPIKDWKAKVRAWGAKAPKSTGAKPSGPGYDKRKSIRDSIRKGRTA